MEFWKNVHKQLNMMIWKRKRDYTLYSIQTIANGQLNFIIAKCIVRFRHIFINIFVCFFLLFSVDNNICFYFLYKMKSINSVSIVYFIINQFVVDFSQLKKKSNWEYNGWQVTPSVDKNQAFRYFTFYHYMNFKMNCRSYLAHQRVKLQHQKVSDENSFILVFFPKKLFNFYAY